MACSVIGHRGFKATYTENTIQGFEKCFQCGASTIETDLWTSRDNVLVVSHDVSTARIFCSQYGYDTHFNILDTDFGELSGLRTIKSGEPLLTFKDLLVWFRRFVESGPYSQCKIMLDLKNSNPPELLKLLVEDVLEVGPDLEWWYPRLQLGIWNIRFLKYLNQDPFFQTLKQDPFFQNPEKGPEKSFFDIFHISLSWEDTMTYLSYAQYLSELDNKQTKRYGISGVSMIYVSMWSSECIEKFLPSVKEHKLTLVNWTVNTAWQLTYFTDVCRYYQISNYGVISDNPSEMVGFVSQITDNDEPRKPYIPWKFRVINWLIKTGTRLSPKSPLISRASFDTKVDPKQRLPSRPTLANKIFAFLQAMGIF